MSNKRGRATARQSQRPLGEPELANVGAGFWKILCFALSLVLIGVGYRLWFSETSFAKIQMLEARLAAQHAKNAKIAEQNRRLVIEIEALKNGMDEIETRAREDLGLVKADETFYLVIDEVPGQAVEGTPPNSSEN